MNYECTGSGKWVTTDGIKIVVAPATLYEQMARTDLGKGWHVHIREMMCQVWGIDAPYSWHMERVFMKYGPESFAGNVEFCRQMGEWYVTEIQEIEDKLTQSCGVSLSFNV